MKLRGALVALCLLFCVAGVVAYMWVVTPPSPPPGSMFAEPSGAPADPPRKDPDPRQDPVNAVAGEKPRPGFPKRIMAPEQHRQRVQRILRKLARGAATAENPSAEAPVPGGEAPSDEDKPTGKLDKEYIRGAVREIVPLVKECYENALTADPNLSGKLNVRFEIVADEQYGGLVADSRIDQTRDNRTMGQLAECVQETMYALELPPPEGGGKVVVNYPFIFRSSKDELSEK